MFKNELELFYENGYVIFPSLFNLKEIKQIQNSFVNLYDAALELGETKFIKNSKFVFDEGYLNRIVWCSGYSPELMNFSLDKRLLRPASAFLNSINLNLIISQAHFKMPGTKVSFPFHQDSQNRGFGSDQWKDLNGKGSFVQTIMAIDEVTSDNTPIKVFPKSHLDGHLFLNNMNKEILNETLSKYNSEELLMKPGDVVMFHPYLIHGSDSNSSNKPRRVFINGYAFPGANNKVYPGCGKGMMINDEAA
jgi:ectoine hydroxylase-related dioxygenase (phytanoyl-CoA dioxygenase family)